MCDPYGTPGNSLHNPLCACRLFCGTSNSRAASVCNVGQHDSPCTRLFRVFRLMGMSSCCDRRGGHPSTLFLYGIVRSHGRAPLCAYRPFYDRHSRWSGFFPSLPELCGSFHTSLFCACPVTDIWCPCRVRTGRSSSPYRCDRSRISRQRHPYGNRPSYDMNNNRPVSVYSVDRDDRICILFRYACLGAETWSCHG
jgi:hypothetical protein